MNIFNKKTILFFSISTLMINGCVAKNEFEAKSPKRVVVSAQKVQNKNFWKKVTLAKIKKEDCVDCYATPMDYSKPPSSANNLFTKTLKKPVKSNYGQDKVIDSKNYGAYDYIERASDTTVKTDNYAKVNANKHIAPAVSTVNTSYTSFGANNTAIQVGAFRQYNGAKKYMKRYSVLSSKYKVAIKTGRKNSKPLHRVRIEGFKNKTEAKKFMYSYGIRDAFVVIN